jgi:hypothetical protein
VTKINIIVEKIAVKNPRSEKVVKVSRLPKSRKAQEMPSRKLRIVSKRLFFIQRA